MMRTVMRTQQPGDSPLPMVEVNVPGCMVDRQTQCCVPSDGALLVELSLKLGPRQQVIVSVVCDTDESLDIFRCGERFEVKALVVGGTHHPTYICATGDTEWHQVILVA